ncbi:MAG: hypothetical protein LVR00_00900 [Rhabdochlamydiaceae bacterium]|jgi:hypothetical protein
MIKARIQSEAVRHNIDLFQKSIDGVSTERKSYKAFVNCQTGTLRFTQFDFLDKNDWKAITIYIDPSTHEVEVFDQEKKFFDLTHFDTLAYRVMAETFYVLQYILKKLPDINELPIMKLETPGSRALHRDLVYRAWHPIDRMKAESLLCGKETGTYIFRKDEYAKTLEQELSTILKISVKCMTLTYLDEQAAIKDKTLVQYKNQWLFYEGDPSLSGTAYDDIAYLIGSNQEVFINPLEY